jgi:hypothetical protein
MSQRAGVQLDLDVRQPATTAADEVVVATGPPIVTDGIIAEFDFANSAVPGEPAQRVINGCVSNPRMLLLNTRKDLSGGGMVVARTNDFQNGPAVAGERRQWLHLE